jgi:hypothetical protein
LSFWLSLFGYGWGNHFPVLGLCLGRSSFAAFPPLLRASFGLAPCFFYLSRIVLTISRLVITAILFAEHPLCCVLTRPGV